MSKSSFIIGSSLVFALFAVAVAEPMESARSGDTTSIPLSDVWGYNIRGARDIRELEPKADPSSSVEELNSRLDVWKILKALHQFPSPGEKAGPAFVVVGSGKKALENAQKGFANKKDRKTGFPPNTDLTLVWFSHPCGRHLRLVAVERSAQQFNLKYQFVSHNRANATTHFALIPLGRLPEGNYKVNVMQIQPIDVLGNRAAPLRNPQRLVSDSCSFSVQRE